MKRVILLFVAITFLSGIAIAQSAEPVPFKEFIAITEKVLDVLDEIEVVFSNNESMKIEVNTAFKKLDIEMLKYRRYVQDWRKSPGKQAAIIKAISNAHVLYKITETEEELKKYGKAQENEGIYGKSHESAKLYAQEARELFVKYKM